MKKNLLAIEMGTYIVLGLLTICICCYGESKASQPDSSQVKATTVPGDPDKVPEAVIPNADSSLATLNSAAIEENRIIKRLAFDLAFENYRYRTGRQTDVYEFAFQLYLDNLRVQETQRNMTASVRSMVSDLKHMRSQAVDKVLKKYGL